MKFSPENKRKSFFAWDVCDSKSFSVSPAFAFFPILIIIAVVSLLGTGAYLYKVKVESGEEQGELENFQFPNSNSQSISNDSISNSNSNSNLGSDNSSPSVSESLPPTGDSSSSQSFEEESFFDRDSAYLTSSDFKDLDKISYLSDTISNDELEDSKISLVGESGDFVDNLHLGETLKIQGGEGIDTEVLNNEVVVSGEDANTDNKGIASFDDSQFDVTSGNVTIDDIYVKNTGDSIDGDLVLNGNFNANGNVVVRDDATVNGNLTGNKGLSVTGGNINLNVSSNYPTNINTGTSTGNISLGSGSNTISLDSSDWDISTSGKLTGISGIDNDGYYTQTGTDANTFTGITTFSNPTYSALFTGGNVGIGTMSPAEKIDIAGNIQLTGNLLFNNNLSSNGIFIRPSVATTGNSSRAVSFQANLNSTSDTDGGAGIELYSDNTGVTNSGRVNIYAYGQGTGGNSNSIRLFTRSGVNAVSERMRVASNGNIGIGSTNPTALLHVAGTTLFQNSANAVNSYQFNNATGTSVMSVDTTNGRVGIGTTSPSQTFQVNGNVGVRDISLGNVYTMNGGTNGLEFHSNVTYANSGYRWYYNNGQGGGSDTLGLSLSSVGDFIVNGNNSASNGSLRMYANRDSYFLGTGNFGLGSSGPDRRLDVLDASNPQLRLTHTDGSVYTDLQTTSAGNLYINPSGGNVGIGTTAPSQKLMISGGNMLMNSTNYINFFNTNYGIRAYLGLEFHSADMFRYFTAGTEKFRISTAGGFSFGNSYAATDPGPDNMIVQGNVGIGTTNLGSKLDVVDNKSATMAMIRVQNTSTTVGSSSGFYGLVSNGTSSFALYGDSAVSADSPYNVHLKAYQGEAALQFHAGNATTPQMVISSSDKIGIGTTSPSYKLDVAGDLNVSDSSEIRIGGTQVLSKGAGSLTGNLFVGNGGGSVINTTGSEGYYNTAIGMGALSSITTGNFNNALGYVSLTNNTTGTYNTALGGYTLQYNVGGGSNTALGHSALNRNTSGVHNTGVGLGAGYWNQTGNYNTLVGRDSGNGVTGNSYSNNTMIGYQTGYSTTTGGNNFFGGYQSGYSNTTGTGIVAVGYQAGYSNTTSNNTFIGNQAGYNNIDGYMNAFHGYRAGYSNTTGALNTFMGYQSGLSNTTGNNNTAFGTDSLKANTTGLWNTAIGFNTLASSITGSENTALGSGSLSKTTGYRNTALGAHSIATNVDGNYNTAVGNYSMHYGNTGSGNTVVGYGSGYYLTGNNNTFLGQEAGGSSSVTSGTGNVFLGYQAGYSETGSNKLYIDNSNTATPLIGGDFSTDTLTITGQMVVGSPTGGAKGTGTINATAVYDDNVLLTDYVFDKYFDGVVQVSDVPLHADYSMLSLDQMADYISVNRHLPTIPGRDEWERNGKFSLGVLANHLWETAETQALYVVELNNKVSDLNGKWIMENGENEIGLLKSRVEELENFQFSIFNSQSISNSPAIGGSPVATNSNDSNSNENANQNDNTSESSDMSDSSYTSNSNLNSNDNVETQIETKLALLGISDLGESLTGFLREVWFSAKVTFEKTVAFMSEVTFGGKVKFEEKIAVGKDSAGRIVLPKGATEVAVSFEKEYEKTPIVNITLLSEAKLDYYIVKDIKPTGFAIKISPSFEEDLTFNWMALEGEESFSENENINDNEEQVIDNSNVNLNINVNENVNTNDNGE